MEDERIQLMWIFFVALLASSAHSLCPVRCVCDDDSLKVSCVAASLEVIPIQLNPAVQLIDLAENKITDVHFTLKIYTNLNELNLSKNRIDDLGSSNFELQYNLRLLNLSYNIISSLMKDSFKGLKNLKVLDLSNNNLKELPALAFKELQSLLILKANRNKLEYVEPGLLKHTKQLQKLYLDDNQLTQVPSDALAEGTKLRLLSLSGNLMEIIEEEAMPLLPQLQTLLLNNNVLNDIDPGVLSNLESLEVLDLSDNNFTAVPTDSLSKLSNLTKLYLSGNFVQSIPAVAFRGLFHLRFLYLDRLEVLTHIDPRAFVDNINLESICLDDNIAFQLLPINLFHGNPRIYQISLTNNQISTLEVSHFPLDKLEVLKVGGNPLHCNCSLFWLWQLLQEQVDREAQNRTQDNEIPDLTLDVRNISCAGPPFLSDKLLVDVIESEIVCSLGWVPVLYVSLSFLVLLGVILVLLYYGVIKRRLELNEVQPKAGPSHYSSVPVTIPYEDSQKKYATPCTSRYLLPKINDTWTFSGNLMQISR